MSDDTTNEPTERAAFDALKLLRAFRMGHEKEAGKAITPAKQTKARQIPTEDFKQNKRSLRAKEDNWILATYGEKVNPSDLPPEPETVEQLLRNCEAELAAYQFKDFDEPTGRDRIQAATELINAWGEISRGEPTAALHIFNAARALERLRIESLTRPPTRTGSTFLEDATKAAWLYCGGIEGKPTFEEIKAALEAHGVKEATRRVKTNRKNFDGSPIIRTESTGRLKWKEPGSKKVQEIAVVTLRNRLSKWRKEWIHGAK